MLGLVLVYGVICQGFLVGILEHPSFDDVYDSGDLTVPVEAMALNLYGTGKGPGRSIGFF